MGLVAMGGEKPTKQPNSLQTYANLKHRNHIQRLSLVKSMCVLIHIKFGTYCLSLCSGLTVITHLDKRSAIGLCLPGTWITMTSMAVISQMFLWHKWLGMEPMPGGLQCSMHWFPPPVNYPSQYDPGC